MKNQVEMFEVKKVKYLKFKNSLVGHKRRLEMTEERLKELEDGYIETIHL